MKNLIKFQVDRGLNKKEYEPLNEHANIFAELMESIGLDVSKEKRPALKNELSKFVALLKQKKIATQVFEYACYVPSEDRVDAYCDVITFCVGAVMKLGYNPIISIDECGKEINSRIGSMVDGKFEKDLSDKARLNWYKADYSIAKD